MTLAILYRGRTVRPICQRLATIAREKFGVPVLVTNRRLREPSDMVLRWGSPKRFKAKTALNSGLAVRLANHKIQSRHALEGLTPTTWTRLTDVDQLPVVVRPRRHYGGKHLYVAKDRVTLSLITQDLGEWYASPLVEKIKEFRVFVLQGRVLAVTQKYPGSGPGIAWNQHQGGTTRIVLRHKWSMDVVAVALSAAARIGLDWAAVDLYVDADGKIGVFEVNTAPGLKTERALTRLARALAWATKNPYPGRLTGPFSSWKDVIHPSLLALGSEDPNE